MPTDVYDADMAAVHTNKMRQHEIRQALPDPTAIGYTESDN